MPHCFAVHGNVRGKRISGFLHERDLHWNCSHESTGHEVVHCWHVQPAVHWFCWESDWITAKIQVAAVSHTHHRTSSHSGTRAALLIHWWCFVCEKELFTCCARVPVKKPVICCRDRQRTQQRLVWPRWRKKTIAARQQTRRANGTHPLRRDTARGGKTVRRNKTLSLRNKRSSYRLRPNSNQVWHHTVSCVVIWNKVCVMHWPKEKMCNWIKCVSASNVCDGRCAATTKNLWNWTF